MSIEKEAFIAGARWARMAGDKAFDEALLEEDSSRYVADGVIRCRGTGTLEWLKRTQVPTGEDHGR